MNRPTEDRAAPPRRKYAIGKIGAAILLLILIIVAVQGILRGGGEAVGVDEAAPGTTNSKTDADRS